MFLFQVGWSQKNVIKVHVYKQLKKVRDDVSQDASLESLGITPDHMLKVIYKWQTSDKIIVSNNSECIEPSILISSKNFCAYIL